MPLSRWLGGRLLRLEAQRQQTAGQKTEKDWVYLLTRSLMRSNPRTVTSQIKNNAGH